MVDVAFKFIIYWLCSFQCLSLTVTSTLHGQNSRAPISMPYFPINQETHGFLVIWPTQPMSCQFRHLISLERKKISIHVPWFIFSNAPRTELVSNISTCQESRTLINLLNRDLLVPSLGCRSLSHCGDNYVIPLRWMRPITETSTQKTARLLSLVRPIIILIILYIEDLPLFVVGYDFYPMSCVFSIHKPWEILFTPFSSLNNFSVAFQMQNFLTHFYSIAL